MAIEEIEQEQDISKDEETKQRMETMPLSKIDVDKYADFIDQRLTEWEANHEEFFEDREDWLAATRDLAYQPTKIEDPDIHIPYTLTMAKSMHARIYQPLSHQNFFSVESINDAFIEKEETIKNFMTWTWFKHLNRGEGAKAVLDQGIDQFVKDGSVIFKRQWERYEDTYMELEEGIEVEEQITIEPDEFGELVEVANEVPVKTLRDVEKTIKEARGKFSVVKIDDFRMPQGYSSVRQAPWVSHRVWLNDDELRTLAQQGVFDLEATEEAMESRQNVANSQGYNQSGSHAREALASVEGITSKFDGTSKMAHDTLNHEIEEFYCRGIVSKEIEDEDYQDFKTEVREIVLYYHKAAKMIIGWNYVHRICPDGLRPFSKADFIPSEERFCGIGCCELLYSINMYMDAMHQLKMDNGLLSSLQWGVYRSTSSLNSDTFRIRPGEMVPVEDINDVRLMNFPYLGNFGEQEEQVLNTYGEKLLALNDINLGNLSGKGVAGALRNATGASVVDKQSSIQLHPHLDRIARALSETLNGLFMLYRERIEEKLVFRVTGHDGRPVFGDVDRNTLRGRYDFSIDVDMLAQSDAEAQQQATLLMQTFLNPTWMQLGLVNETNLYNIGENYLKAHGIKRPYLYLTKPQGYKQLMTPEQRFFRIVHKVKNPPIEETVSMNEDHQAALDYLLGLQAEGNEDMFGLLTAETLADYNALIQRHQEMLQMLQNPNPVPNASGTQMPGQGGLPALGPEGGGTPANVEGGPLGSPQGEVNGPVQ